MSDLHTGNRTGGVTTTRFLADVVAPLPISDEQQASPIMPCFCWKPTARAGSRRTSVVVLETIILQGIKKRSLIRDRERGDTAAVLAIDLVDDQFLLVITAAISMFTVIDAPHRTKDATGR